MRRMAIHIGVVLAAVLFAYAILYRDAGSPAQTANTTEVAAPAKDGWQLWDELVNTRVGGAYSCGC